jgi:hypothetical protein
MNVPKDRKKYSPSSLELLGGKDDLDSFLAGRWTENNSSTWNLLL